MIPISASISGPGLLALPALADSVLHRRRLNAALAPALRRELQDHLVLRGQEPNKKGWPSSGFFEARARAISIGPIDDSSASVLIRDDGGALARKINGGGPIVPKERKWLTIPAIAEAYGKTPTSFIDLRFQLFTKRGGSPLAALIQNQQSPVKFGRKRKDGTRAVKRGETIGGRVFYWLKKSVNPPKDPRALPDSRRLGDALLAAGMDYLDQEIRRFPALALAS